jgi:hypothetical protein
MKLVEMQVSDLIKPDQFKLTSQDELFDRLVSVVNNELDDAVNKADEIFETSDAHVEVILNADDDFSDDVTEDMVAALNTLYQQVGWKGIEYTHQDETEDEYESHTFKFYFKNKAIPGISL